MKRLLFISHRLPYPPDKGERTRAFRQIVSLSEQFEITVAALSHREMASRWAQELGRWADQVLVAPVGPMSLMKGAWSLLGGHSVTEGYFHSRAFRGMIMAEHANRPFDVVVGYSSSVLPYVLAVDAPVRVMDLVDADSAKWSSYAADSHRPLRWAYRREARGVGRLERQAISECDAAVVVTETEADALGAAGANVHVIANGVDPDYFSPDGVSPANLGPAALVFMGTMDYRPNVDAVCWFVKNVWPAVHQRVANASFVIVGREPAPAVARLAQTPGVVVTGTVADVRPYLVAAAAVACPLQISRGIPNKVLEAMAMGKPVLASPQAVQGLDLRVGCDLLQADSPESWATGCVQLLTERTEADRLGRAARTCVTDHYSWRRQLQPLVDLCVTLSERAPSPVG